MKIKKCPKCDSTNLGDRWVANRKLQQYCGEEDCRWTAMPRIPERMRITNIKNLRIDDFYGWNYITYDKYGHASCYSQTFGNEAEAMKALEDTLKRSSKNNSEGNLTGVLFFTPHTMPLKGKMFKVHGAVVKRIK